MCCTISTSKVRIRKGRRCFGCERFQPAGTEMHAKKTRGGGRLYTLHLCGRCAEVADGLDYGDTYGQGDLLDEELKGK